MAERYEGTLAFPNGFKPNFHPDRLIEPWKLKPPSISKRKRKPWIAKAFPDNWMIFEVDMGDAFGDWVPDSWIGNLLFTIANCPKHIFLMLTKNARNLMKWNRFFPPNLFLGVSVTRQEDIGRIFHLRMTTAKIKVISFEPLLGPINTNLDGIDWVIIGAQTQPAKIPQKGWVKTLMEQARKLKTPIFLKDNVKYGRVIREFPNEHRDSEKA